MTPPRAGPDARTERRPGRTVAADAGRAQTTVDYAVGVSVFLIVVAFVFAFVPTMFDPFAGEQGESLVADRAATQLSSDLLADPATPYALDGECVEDFFEGSGPVPDQCGYDTRSLRDALGVDPSGGLNVTLERGGVTVHSAGPSAASNSVVTAQRFVTVDGRAHRLYVRAW